MQAAKPVRFGAFEVDLSTGELRKGGTPVRLQEQPAKILAVLLERPGEVVTREDLVKLLWPDGTFVDYDRGLNAAINRLRQALSDSAESPRYVETVARRGYRFIAPVESAEAPVQVAAPEPANASAPRRWAWIVGALSVFALVAGIWLWQSRRERPAPPLDPVPLTSYEGIETEPSFSPDGTQVAFSWNGPNQDNFDIYVKTVGSDPPLRLTTNAAADTNPAWSPDGRYVAFSREGQGIFLIPPSGGIERQLLAVATVGQLSWSPDATTLAYAHAPHAVGTRLFTRAMGSGISLVDTRTGETTNLLASAGSETIWSPAISPDGQSLAWARCPTQLTCKLGVAILARGRLADARYFEQGFGRIAAVAWTVDGRRLVYVTGTYSPTRVWEVHATGETAPRPLNFAGPVTTSSPAISRSGHRLAFSRPLSNYEIWRLESGELVRSPMSSTFTDNSPRFSSDGRKVVFASERSGSAEIWVANTDGSGAVKLTNSRASGSPRWSPDDGRIVYDTVASGGHWDVVVMDTAGLHSAPLVGHPSDDGAPSFSRDGKWIYFTSDRTGRNEVYRIPVEGGEPVGITDEGGWAAQESWDGRSIYYSKVNIGCGSPLFVRTIDGGSERQVIEGACGRGFEVTGRGVYFTDGVEEDGMLRVRLYDPATGNTRVVDQTKGPLYGPIVLTVSPDGNTILLGASRQSGADLYLVENFR